MTVESAKRPKEAKIIAKLFDDGLLTEEAVNDVFYELETSDMPLLDVLENKGLLTQQIVQKLENIYGFKIIRIQETPLDEKALQLLSSDFIKQRKILPLALKGNNLLLGMVNPQDLSTIDDVRMITKTQVEPAIILASDFSRYISGEISFKKKEETIFGKESDAEAHSYYSEPQLQKESLIYTEEDSVINLVDTIVEEAVLKRASDVHIEPYEDKIVLRYRIDGSLLKISEFPKSIGPAIVSRIKILSSLDISERRRPQDGRMHLNVANKEIDMRVSIMPCTQGEKVVLRIFDKKAVAMDLEALGFPERELKTFKQILQKPYGIIFVTGPTGSGKSTTLYSALSLLNREDVNILTAEDPVEFYIPGITQSQVNPQINLTFATLLRSFLRQDPDIIMVGEIRDSETAEIAVRAAMTGHLVLSTLHTNDAASAFPRLMDMDVEPFLLASSTLCILAQRLVRKVCAECVREVPMPEDMKIALGISPGGFGFGPVGEVTYFEGTGCSACFGTGYKGRIVVPELLVVNDEVRSLVMSRAPSKEIKSAAIRGGMRTMRENGVDLIFRGITTPQEIVKKIFTEE
ncbi:GspE/PulE family protein [Thermodesulfobium acidiphilum]|uniref:GspE/PulE family protein n=1 Tax=Thermodesulfobium acidiphilum TaxID=1794699 RepID=UPI000D387AF5|nr:GspE/PulE family protein [Thermodesulfobium acidiphilum]